MAIGAKKKTEEVRDTKATETGGAQKTAQQQEIRNGEILLNITDAAGGARHAALSVDERRSQYAAKLGETGLLDKQVREEAAEELTDGKIGPLDTTYAKLPETARKLETEAGRSYLKSAVEGAISLFRTSRSAETEEQRQLLEYSAQVGGVLADLAPKVDEHNRKMHELGFNDAEILKFNRELRETSLTEYTKARDEGRSHDEALNAAKNAMEAVVADSLNTYRQSNGLTAGEARDDRGYQELEDSSKLLLNSFVPLFEAAESGNAEAGLAIQDVQNMDQLKEEIIRNNLMTEFAMNAMFADTANVVESALQEEGEETSQDVPGYANDSAMLMRDLLDLQMDDQASEEEWQERLKELEEEAEAARESSEEEPKFEDLSEELQNKIEEEMGPVDKGTGVSQVAANLQEMQRQQEVVGKFKDADEMLEYPPGTTTMVSAWADSPLEVMGYDQDTGATEIALTPEQMKAAAVEFAGSNPESAVSNGTAAVLLNFEQDPLQTVADIPEVVTVLEYLNDPQNADKADAFKEVINDKKNVGLRAALLEAFARVAPASAKKKEE